MPVIKKILFPVDFSERSIGAARYVEALAGRFNAELMLLHVVTDGTHTLAEMLEPARREQLDSFLKEELKYIQTQRVCIVGDDLAASIVETARSWQPDLVMMPTHGLGFYRRLLLGSVTAKETAPELEQITVRRILCAIGLDANSPCVFSWGTFLAREYGAELAIVHAVPTPEASVPVKYLDEEYAAALAVEARKRIEALESASGLEARILVERGEPAAAVSKVAKDFGADVIVIGRHSTSGLAAHLKQNAYAILRDSPCPVISV